MLGTNAFDTRAVTPVIGVVMLVTITVLLAGTAAAFFFGVTQRPAEASQPTAVFEFEEDLSGHSDSVAVEHVGGERIPAATLYVDVDGAACTPGGSPDGRYNVADDFSIGATEMSAGMTVRIGPDLDFDGTRDLCTSGGDLDLSEATVTVVWTDSDGTRRAYTSWRAAD